MSLSEDEVKSICADLLCTKVDDIEFPGGSSRESVRVRIAGKGLIVTRRKKLQRARLESGVLRILNQHNAPVPHLIAYRGNYLIQQDVGSNRLTQRLSTANKKDVLTLLESALASLLAIHKVGKNSEPLQSITTLGKDPQWLGSFVRSAERLGSRLNLPAPVLAFDKLAMLLHVDQPCFIKWDARPGNAVVRESGKVIWIDWEHCGKRHPLDDVAWLLSDEYTPHLEELEDALIAKILPSFAHGYSQSRAQEYLSVYGTMHACIRLAMIRRYQEKNGWWDYAYCLEFDKVGVVLELAIRVCERASRWSQNSALTRSLSPWFEDLIPLLNKSIR